MTTTPAQELTAAAGKLRTLATDATPGPWAASHPEERWEVYRDSQIVGGGKPLAAVNSEYNGAFNADWIAAMHPGVGAALAQLLDRWAWLGRADPDLLNRVGGPEALAVARLINGTAGGEA